MGKSEEGIFILSGNSERYSGFAHGMKVLKRTVGFRLAARACRRHCLVLAVGSLLEGTRDVGDGKGAANGDGQRHRYEEEKRTILFRRRDAVLDGKRVPAETGNRRGTRPISGVTLAFLHYEERVVHTLPPRLTGQEKTSPWAKKGMTTKAKGILAVADEKSVVWSLC